MESSLVHEWTTRFGKNEADKTKIAYEKMSDIHTYSSKYCTTATYLENMQ